MDSRIRSPRSRLWIEGVSRVTLRPAVLSVGKAVFGITLQSNMGGVALGFWQPGSMDSARGQQLRVAYLAMPCALLPTTSYLV